MGALSEGCRDLLDKIFVVDPKQRITVAAIMQHPWFSQPMAEPFAGSLEKMRTQNRALSEHVANRTLDQVRAITCATAERAGRTYLPTQHDLGSCSVQLS